MTRVVRAVGTLAVVTALLAGCSGSDGGDAAGPPSLDSEAREHLGAEQSLAFLRFRPVTDLAKSPASTGQANRTYHPKDWIATYEDSPEKAKKQDPEPPAILTFLERRGVTSGTQMSMRAQMSTLASDAEIDTTEVDIPGASSATLMKSTYTARGDDYPSTQWDIMVVTGATPEYHVRYGAPTDQFDRRGAQAMVDSMWVKGGSA